MFWIHDLILEDDTPEIWTDRREAIKKRVMAMLGRMPGDKVQLEISVLEEKDCGSHIQRKVEYSTESEFRVRAYLLIPKEIGEPAPAVLCFHGTSPDGKLRVVREGGAENRAYASELAERGYVTLAPDALTMGEQLMPNARPLDTRPFQEKFPDRTVEGKTLWDHMCAVDLLEALDEVDDSRIGAMGHSLGGRSTHYLAAFDERIYCSMMSCGITPFTSNFANFWHGDSYDPLPTVGKYFEEHRKLPFEKHEIMSLIPPRPLLIVSPFNDLYNLRTDQISEMAHRVFEVYRLLGKPENLSRYAHGDGHDTTPYTRELVYRWFDIHLKGGDGSDF